jgi:hypothetical protein
MGKFAETANVDYSLSFADQGKQTSFPCYPFDAVLVIFPQSNLKNCQELEYTPISAKFPPKIAEHT